MLINTVGNRATMSINNGKCGHSWNLSDVINIVKMGGTRWGLVSNCGTLWEL